MQKVFSPTSSKYVIYRKSTISRWVQMFRKRLLTKKDKYRDRISKLTVPTQNMIIDHVLMNKTITLKELKKWVERTLKVRISPSTLSRLLKKNKVSCKNTRRHVIKSNTLYLQSQFRSKM